MIGSLPAIRISTQSLGTLLARGNAGAALQEAHQLSALLQIGGAGGRSIPSIERGLGSRSPNVRQRTVEILHTLARTYLAEAGPDAFLPNGPPGEALDLLVEGEPDREKIFDAEYVAGRAREGWGPQIYDEARRLGELHGFVRCQEDRFFEEMMGDPRFKTRMIAFLYDVASVHPRHFRRLLRKLFPREKSNFPGRLGGLVRLGTGKFVPNWALATAVRLGVGQMGRRFLAGKNHNQALKTADRLAAEGLLTTLDVVWENVDSNAQAEKYLGSVLDLLDRWSKKPLEKDRTAGGVPVRHISIKLSALVHRFDPVATDQVVQEAAARLVQIYKKAKETGAMVNIDLETNYVRDLSYRILFKALTDPELAGWDDAAVVVQAYLKESGEVMMQLIDLAKRTGKKIQIRVVKGAYHQYEQIVARQRGWEVPVYTTPAETDRNFLNLARLALLNHDSIRVAIGSHNVPDIAKIQVMREMLGIPIEEVECQFLLGVGDDLARAVAKLGIPVRVYAPTGPNLMAIGYLVRRLDEVSKGSAIAATRYLGTYEDCERAMSARPGGVQVAEPPERAFQNEPQPNFSGEVRVAMEEALQKCVIGQVVQANREEAEKAVDLAEEGFAEWSGLKQEKRSDILRKAAKIARERKYKIAALIVLEAGKPWKDAVNEVNEGIDFLNYYAAQAEKKEMAGRDPLGVALAIAPFNFPFAIAIGMLSGALAVGNAGILKPSGQTPVVGQMVVEILREAGVPQKAVQFLPAPGKMVGEVVVANPKVDLVIMTGSTETADEIIETAARSHSVRNKVKVVVAETGGKNVIYVDKTADLDLAAEGIIQSTFVYNGQKCSACSIAIVDDSVADALVEKLVQGAMSMTVGDARRPETELGRQIDEASLAKVRGYIQRTIDAIKAGRLRGKLEYPAPADVSPLKGGPFIGPHIFTVPPDAEIARKEIFGPVLSVIRVKGFDEAIDVANGVGYGLTAGLYSRDPAVIRKFRNRIEAGVVYLNRGITGAIVGRQPFGGAKDSGTGPQAGGPDYLQGLTKSRERGPGTADWSTELIPSVHQSWSFPSIPRDEMTGIAARELRDAQSEWAKEPVEGKRALLRRLLTLMTKEFRNATASELKMREWTRAYLLVVSYWKNAPSFLTPQPTAEVPGESNEQVHDWPLGIGLIWGHDEYLPDMVAATAASLVMGNAVMIPDCVAGRRIRALFLEAGFPHDLIRLVRRDPSEILGEPWLDFAVAHGPDGPDVNRRLLEKRGRRIGFKRPIGMVDDPGDWAYLTRFAHARTLVRNNVSHGAIVDLVRLSH